jgi:hypothetical protein
MKHISTVSVPATTETVVDKITCDLCSETIASRSCEVDDVTITYANGSNYPEGSIGEDIFFDLCGKCFTDKLVPWMKAQGAEPQTREWYT